MGQANAGYSGAHQIHVMVRLADEHPMRSEGYRYQCAECRTLLKKKTGVMARGGFVAHSGGLIADPSPEQMASELQDAGWKKQSATVWVDQNGTLFRGPHAAWRAMKEVR